jgi:hypothetical protein
VTDQPRFYEAPASGARRSAPAALRNREPIAEVLRKWLPGSGLVLEIASGSGEHVVHFAGEFPLLEWQPSDVHPSALESIRAWGRDAQLANVRPPLVIDAAAAEWPISQADAVLCINMVHISPWASALGLIDGAARLLPKGGALILYGPWLKVDMPTAASNLAFDADLKARNPEWGLRKVEDLAAEARKRRLELEQTHAMPANNLMLLLRRRADVK